MLFPNKESIYALPILDRFLIYSPLNSVAALVNQNALPSIKQLEHPIESKSSPAGMDELIRLLNSPGHAPELDLNRPFNPRVLGLLPTRQCNLSCIYCDFGSDSSGKEKLSVEMAINAIRWMIDLKIKQGEDSVRVHFFGGEPLIDTKSVLEIVQQGRNLIIKKGLKPYFEVSTNGIIDSEEAEQLGIHFDAVVLSIDGFSENHDFCRPFKNRTGSYDRVSRTAAILGESQTELCLRCCVNSKNVDQLPAITDWFCRSYQPAYINFEPLSGKGGECNESISPPDPYSFARNFTKARFLGETFSTDVVFSSVESQNPQYSICPVGQDTTIFTPDGKINSCYLPETAWQSKGMDLNLGSWSENGEIRINPASIREIRQLSDEKKRCERCFCKWTCAGGCRVNRTYPGCDPAYDSFCLQTRLLQAVQILQKLDEVSLAKSLLDNTEAMQFLAQHEDDRLFAEVY